MRIKRAVRRAAAKVLRNHGDLKRLAIAAEDTFERCRHSAAEVFPLLIRPRPQLLMIAVTANCNARCIGCRYGRDFMPGHELSWPTTRDLLDDAADLGYDRVRFYGGEPLLHPDLPRMVEHAVTRGLKPYVTTNGVLLGRRLDDLFAAGLRDITMGIYGIGDAYDRYVQRQGLFARVESSIQCVRERYGMQVDLQMNWLLMRPTCSVDALRQAYAFARAYDMSLQVDLIHYSLPYFTEGPDRQLQFRPADRSAIERVTDELLDLQRSDPMRIRHSPEGIRAMPDWLILGPAMRVPCTAAEMVWVGPDGTVQMCYVTFRLGNLHDKRFRDIAFNSTHCAAARDAFALNCPNCHCSADRRVLRHAPTRQRYARHAASLCP
jgi:cyclic pyranopterin phosphate synthase